MKAIQNVELAAIAWVTSPSFIFELHRVPSLSRVIAAVQTSHWGENAPQNIPVELVLRTSFVKWRNPNLCHNLTFLRGRTQKVFNENSSAAKAALPYNFTNYSFGNDRSRSGLHSKLALHICISPAVAEQAVSGFPSHTQILRDVNVQIVSSSTTNDIFTCHKLTHSYIANLARRNVKWCRVFFDERKLFSQQQLATSLRRQQQRHDNFSSILTQQWINKHASLSGAGDLLRLFRLLDVVVDAVKFYDLKSCTRNIVKPLHEYQVRTASLRLFPKSAKRPSPLHRIKTSTSHKFNDYRVIHTLQYMYIDLRDVILRHNVYVYIYRGMYMYICLRKVYYL